MIKEKTTIYGMSIKAITLEFYNKFRPRNWYIKKVKRCWLGKYKYKVKLTK